jgi:hypothetical protein
MYCTPNGKHDFFSSCHNVCGLDPDFDSDFNDNATSVCSSDWGERSVVASQVRLNRKK